MRTKMREEIGAMEKVNNEKINEGKKSKGRKME